MNHSGMYFKWPSKQDIQIIPDNGVLCRLKPPKYVTQRLVTFDDSPVKKALEQLQ